MLDYHEQLLCRLLDVLDVLNCGVFLADRGGTIEYANRRLSEMMCRLPVELAGVSLRRLYAADPTPEVDRVLATLSAGIAHEFYLPMSDGVRRPVVMCGRPLPVELGEPPRIVVTVQDITLQKATEVEVRDQFEDVSALSDTVISKALALQDYSRELEEAVRQRTAELYEANLEAVTMLAVASEARDTGTGQHVRRIQQYAQAVALRMGMSPAEAERIGHSAILHDVGKMQVPDAILQKPGALTDDERKAIEQHTLVGERILSKAPFFETARQIARSHHENWNGSGYPDGLAGEAIPLEARIVRVVDVYDGLVSQRVYKAAWPKKRAIEYLRENAGVLFDPRIVDAFISQMQRRPA